MKDQETNDLSGGDIMKICKIGNDFVIEGDAGCTTAGFDNGQGRNGGEFFFTEEYPFPASGAQYQCNE